MDKLLLIDGSSILTTSFYATVPQAYYRTKTEEEKEKILEKLLKTSSGIYTNGVFVFCKILLNILENQNPSHIAVAWDIARNTFRKKAYPLYKANRKDTPGALKSQFGLMIEVLKAMNIVQFINPEYEADDLIGSACKKFEDHLPVYIYTKDQDALQLVSDKTKLWLITDRAEALYEKTGRKNINAPHNAFEFDPCLVEEIYGLKPEQIIHKKAIEGDTSDNIPGVKGVGEKTIIPLLQKFKTIEGLYDYIENTPEPEIKELLKELGIKKSPLSCLLKKSETGSIEDIAGKKAAFLSKDLATIYKDENLIPYSLGDLKVNIDYDGANNKFKSLKFKSLINNISA